MIISVERAKNLIDFKGWDDEKIELKLKAVEQTIRAYTNNNFQMRTVRGECGIVSGTLIGTIPGLSVGDTVQISESLFNNGLYVVEAIGEDSILLDVALADEAHALVTKIVYPADVIDCCVNLLSWEVNNRDKVGVQSETISRHSVTYFNMDGANNVMGYPASLLGCLKAYKKARC